MYYLKYIFLILVFIIQNSLAVSLNDIENINKTKLIKINTTGVKLLMQNIPSLTAIKADAILRESKIKLKLALPLLLAGIIELYLQYSCNNDLIENLKICDQLNSVNDIKSCIEVKNYCIAKQQKLFESNVILNTLPLYLVADIVLSYSFLINKSLYKYIGSPLSTVFDKLYSLGIHLYICVHPKAPLFVDDLTKANTFSWTNSFISIFSLYAIINHFYNIYNRSNDSYNVCERVEGYQKNINNRLQQSYQDKYFDKASNIFLYINDDMQDRNSKSAEGFYDYYGSIEYFYKLIALNKKNICSYRIIDFTNTPNNSDNYSAKKLANIFNIYQLRDINYKTKYWKKDKLEFALVEENKFLTSDVLIRALEKPGVKLIEVDSSDIKNKTTYKYVGLMNDSENYYVVFGIQINKDITKLPKTYGQIMSNIILNQPNYLETSALVVKFDSLDKIQSIIEYLFLYLESNCYTCIYDVKLNSNLNQQDK